MEALRTEMTNRLSEQDNNHQSSLAQLQADAVAAADALEQQIAELEERNAVLIKDKSQLDASIQDMAAALRELQDRKEAADARIAEFQNLLTKFADLIDAGRLTVKIVDGRMVVELASDILFESGSAELNEDGDAALREVAAVLASIPERDFQVEGHTDNVPINNRTFASNWELGSARAITVVSTLNEGGVPLERLSASSYAENRPVQGNDTAEGRTANRRIEIVVVPDLSQLPGYSELEKLAAAE